MGWAARAAQDLRSALAGLRVCVDVQHLYRDGKHAGDRGSLYVLASGAKVYETQAATTYAGALCAWLRARGAAVLTNEPASGILTGPYSRRNEAANAWHADAYLACHVNAGGGAYALTEYVVATGAAPLGERIGVAIAQAFPVIRGARTNPLLRGQRGAVCVEACTAVRAALVVEPFFGDNKQHQGLLAAPSLLRLGETIGGAVAEWWDGARDKAAR